MSADGDVTVREISIDNPNTDTAVTIAQLTDLHLSGQLTKADEADSVIKYTHDNHSWGRDGQYTYRTERALAVAAKNADKIIITGDVIDYQSQGSINLVKTVIWDKYSNVTLLMGNHEPLRTLDKTNNPDTTPLADRLAVLEGWGTYSCEMVGTHVMAISLDNGSLYDEGVNGSKFNLSPAQIEQLENDLETARENGYTVLLFYHVPLNTGNPNYNNVKPIELELNENKVTAGDLNAYNVAGRNFYNASELVGRNSADEASARVYDIITSNADVIAAAFCGHRHCDFYTEINAYTPNGAFKTIPQYTLAGTAYTPSVLRITVN